MDSSSALNSIIGQILDEKYRIVKLIGRGGMGDVYQAEHLRLQRQVAVKLLRAQFIEGAQDSDPIKRFEREAKTACIIDHPNAISIFDYGVVDRQPYLVMSLVDGVSLKQFLAEGGRLEVTEVVDILSQVASALEQAHSLGIVHRDLKPDNIMLQIQADGTRRAQVLDFGLAKLVGDSHSGSSLTNTGETLGTPLYMSPEQVQGIQITPASDVYSLGIIAYELLAGDVPFRAEQAMSVLYKHLHDSPPALRDINPEFPELPLVEAVLQKVLAKTAEERSASVTEFVASLKSALDGVEYVPPVKKVEVIPEVEPAVASSKPAAISKNVVIVGVAALLFCVGGISFLLGEKEIESVEKVANAPKTSKSIEKRVLPTTAEISKAASAAINSAPVERKLKEAERLLNDQKPGAAHSILVQVLVQLPQNSKAHFLSAKAKIKMRQPFAARKHLEQAVKFDPENKQYLEALRRAQEIDPRRNIRKKLEEARAAQNSSSSAIDGGELQSNSRRKAAFERRRRLNQKKNPSPLRASQKE